MQMWSWYCSDRSRQLDHSAAIDRFPVHLAARVCTNCIDTRHHGEPSFAPNFELISWKYLHHKGICFIDSAQGKGWNTDTDYRPLLARSSHNSHDSITCLNLHTFLTSSIICSNLINVKIYRTSAIYI